MSHSTQINMENSKIKEALKEKLRRVDKRMSESQAGDKAKSMGLDYMRFGRYGKNGQVTHVTKNGKLVPKEKGTETPGTMSQAASRPPADDMVAKGPTNPDTAKIGKTVVNKAPDSVVNRTSIAGPRSAGQNFGAHFIDKKKAAKFLPALLKKLASDHPNTGIRIEPTDDGFNIFQEPTDIDSQPIGGDVDDYDPNDAALKPREQ